MCWLCIQTIYENPWGAEGIVLGGWVVASIQHMHLELPPMGANTCDVFLGVV